MGYFDVSVKVVVIHEYREKEKKERETEADLAKRHFKLKKNVTGPETNR